jgi:cytochrome b pre-mRNA-processing protein 3
MILAAFRRSQRARNTIIRLYGAIVAQARTPAFYTLYGVADTVEGRFELIVLHLVLVLRRLHGKGGAGTQPNSPAGEIGQLLFDVFCRDLDDNLREMGVGDLAVPRRMRRFGEAFYGRQAAYEAALTSADRRALETALARNILDEAAAGENAARLARYVCAATCQLDAQAEEMVTAGQGIFPSPEAVVDG